MLIRCLEWSHFGPCFELETGDTVVDVLCKETVPVTGCLKLVCRTKTRLAELVAGVGAGHIAEALTMQIELVGNNATRFVETDSPDALVKLKTSIASPTNGKCLAIFLNTILVLFFMDFWLFLWLLYHYFIVWIRQFTSA